MRSLSGILVGGALAVTAAPAGAAPVVELVWVTTSGSGITGSDVIAAAPGDLITAEIRVDGEVGISSYGLSLEFDLDLGDELDVVSVTELTPPGFTFSFTPEEVALVQESSAVQRGRVLTFEAATLGSGPAAFVVGEIVFAVEEGVASDGDDLALGLFHAGADGLFDNDGADLATLTEFGTGAVDAIPEPGGGAPLAVAVLGLVRRWRRAAR